jgi:hypothetical protein
MSMAWERTHRRYELIHAVLAEVARTGRPVVPADLVGEIDDVFGDFAAFLCDVRRRWYLTFDTRLDCLLESPPRDLDRAVAKLWRDLEREQPAMRILLDAHPTPTPVDAHHRDVLLTATGVDQYHLHARTKCVRTRRVS